MGELSTSLKESRCPSPVGPSEITSEIVGVVVANPKMRKAAAKFRCNGEKVPDRLSSLLFRTRRGFFIFIYFSSSCAFLVEPEQVTTVDVDDEHPTTSPTTIRRELETVRLIYQSQLFNFQPPRSRSAASRSRRPPPPPPSIPSTSVTLCPTAHIGLGIGIGNGVLVWDLEPGMGGPADSLAHSRALCDLGLN